MPAAEAARPRTGRTADCSLSTFVAKFRSDLHGCPCGFASDPDRECTCTQQSILRYQRKLSGPLLDRIDAHVEVPRGEKEVRSYCPIEPAAPLVKAAVTQLHLSDRAFHRTLKLARTIADLTGTEGIWAAHVAEAIQYRPRAVV